ncbi:HEAT repeat domain-containing protein [Glycomyces sp. NPDC046736]|uniref:HEAT repeat domain-containing protein n=1 Tax=Glycomyces sp. NPDC046736 TaxID=3155615 RepID=UPI0033C66865
MIGSAKEFVRLRSSSDPAEYRRAAHEEAPLEVWMAVIADHPAFRQWVAHNKTVPLEVLDLLAGDEDVTVRLVVAGKRKAPDRILRRLAVDPDESVRLRVASHRNAAEATLRMLASDAWDEIRKVVQDRLTTERPLTDPGNHARR